MRMARRENKGVCGLQREQYYMVMLLSLVLRMAHAACPSWAGAGAKEGRGPGTRKIQEPTPHCDHVGGSTPRLSAGCPSTGGSLFGAKYRRIATPVVISAGGGRSMEK
ncbi:hypothetical protein CMUS01_03859 [Colletotrichum musicola]|uniref:Uncharacterized protein n=1 Tax=Colletotrichum musicola TaxID=2175873 RepID=A0A8H6NQC3_9PEZI|nr:hypothetical protein CMUS01_03859 [Colletotrichum musicola]